MWPDILSFLKSFCCVETSLEGNLKPASVCGGQGEAEGLNWV